MQHMNHEHSFWRDVLDSVRAEAILNEAFAMVARQVGAFLDTPLVAEPVAIRTMTLDMLWEHQEQMEAEHTGVYLLTRPPLAGHCLLVLNQATTAYVLARLLGTPAPPPLSLDENAVSALGELGNITITTLLNALAEHVGQTLYPTPPVTMVDMLGAILNVIAVSVGAVDVAFPMIETMLVGQMEAFAIQIWVFPESVHV